MTGQNKMESLLSNIFSLYKKSQHEIIKRTKQGESFNIFNVIGLRSEEVRLHSAFIGELLNPKGSHGAGDLFLKAFLGNIEAPINFINNEKCSKEKITERYIGPITETTGGRIDIIIEDGNHAIIIENKIYAEDQRRQLLRYHNYGKEKFPNGFKLIYLTLDGHEADSYSLGKTDYKYLNISYEEDIHEWLEICYVLAEEKPLVQSVIKQYDELVKQLTNTNMDANYKKDLMSLILKPENVISVGEILKVQSEWWDKIYDEYLWKPLEEYAQSREMKFEKDIEQGESGAWIYKEEWKNYALFIWTDKHYDWKDMYLGISWYAKPNRKSKICRKDFHKLDCLKESPCDGWPYGWEYLPDEIRNWDVYITEDFVSGKVFHFIKEKFDEVLSELEKKKLQMP